MDIFAGDEHHERIEADHKPIFIEGDCLSEIAVPVFHLTGIGRER